ncbi:MAG: hypothetical protein Q7T17_12865 [Microbacterium sp.]|uniref:hypothetical protein n=1 Tax=Microbacterium sp. TaxID=51671 RepID=UPI0027246CD5|nr:hypothetical protein [Microbacterium sp.]MDO8383852.1 hypothetical protein [Microbacterium sp.]
MLIGAEPWRHEAVPTLDHGRSRHSQRRETLETHHIYQQIGLSRPGASRQQDIVACRK